MEPPPAFPKMVHDLPRRELLKAGLTAGVALSAWPLHAPQALWGADAGLPKRGVSCASGALIPRTSIRI
jgi:hypothetical protein